MYRFINIKLIFINEKIFLNWLNSRFHRNRVGLIQQYTFASMLSRGGEGLEVQNSLRLSSSKAFIVRPKIQEIFVPTAFLNLLLSFEI